MKKKLLPLFVIFALAIFAQTQNIPGFISIDCGASNGYTDSTLNIDYTTDDGYVESGQKMTVNAKYVNQYSLQQLWTLREFPNGTRNCYTVRPPQGKNNQYLIRATFAYGNYDNKFQSPTFALYIDVNFWVIMNPTDYTYDEIIYTPSRDYIQVCLVNIGSGTPFISALELRLLDSSTYTVASGALRKRWRENIGSNKTYRYPEDDYDRIWEGTMYDWVTIRNTTNVDILSRNNNAYKVPVEVLMTAQQSLNGSYGMTFYWDTNRTFSWYVYLHFAELQTLQPGQLRQFTVEVNDNNLVTTVTPEYLKLVTVTTPSFSGDVVNYSVTPIYGSNVSSFINADEVFHLLDLPNSPTDLNDVIAIFDIKKTYGVLKQSWQGDPCVPKEFVWTGVNCSTDKYPRITSLTLSSSGLQGSIANSFSNLTSMVSLDLSSNGLTGQIPEYFTQMSNLQFLNLSYNKLTGSIPLALLKRMNDKTLKLSVTGNPDLCQTNCTPSPPVPEPRRIWIIVIAVVCPLVVIFALCILFILRRNRRNRAIGTANRSTAAAGSVGVAVSNDQFTPGSNITTGSGDATESSNFAEVKGDMQPRIVAKNRPFTSYEVSTVTENFRIVIGEGGFGKVYFGRLTDGKQVAVKVLSQSSKQGYREFQAEAQLLMVVYHKNLVSLIGYCEEFETMALLYEYMSNGDLRQYLAGNKANVLTWSQRLQIAVDAAQGLEYLHNGCTPPIIHRDLKTSNILLNEHMQAKIADFGLSRIFATDSAGNQISSTRPAGTPGYLDPVFNTSGNLNKKSDVYSFGIILLELISGQPAIIRSSQGSIHIVRWVTPFIDRGDLHSVVDPRIQGQFNPNSAWKVIEIAMQCVNMLPIQRPDMNAVLADLVDCLSMETDPRRNQGMEGTSLTSTSSYEMTSLDLDINHIAPRPR